MLTRRSCILIGIESTYGVDPGLTPGANAILVEEPTWQHEGARMNERMGARPSAGKLPKVFGGTLKTVSFSMNTRGAGAAYSASVLPECDAALRACGFGATLDTTPSAENVSYSPVSVGYESATIYFYEDGIRHILTGCRGTVSFSMESGGFIKHNYTFTGHENTPTDTAFPAPTYDTTEPVVFKGMSFAVGGYSAIIQTLDFDMGNVIATPADANSSDGFGEIQLTDRAPAGSFDPEAVLIATDDPIADWKAGNSLALATGNAGSTQYNRVSISMPAIQYVEVGRGDRDGIVTRALSFDMHESSGDDEVALLFP